MPMEGFWSGADRDSKGFPDPIPHKNQWKGQGIFLQRLIKLESKLLEEHLQYVEKHNNGEPVNWEKMEEHVISYRGFSSCRICKVMNGSKEFKFNGWQWPEGFRHYIEGHNVKPTDGFVRFINSLRDKG